jgi:hypothetical protein
MKTKDVYAVFLLRFGLDCSDFQAFDNLPADDMDVDDFVDIFIVDVGVPDTFRINHHCRSLFAALKAAGFVDPHFAFAGQAELLDAALGVFLCSLGAAVGATNPVARGTLVQAEKYMVFVKRFIAHGNILE